MNNKPTLTPDDALESPDDIYLPNVDEETLPEDGESPATPAAYRTSGIQLPSDHPAFDSDIDAHEAYDEGELSATGIDAFEEPPEPNKAEPMEWDETI